MERECANLLTESKRLKSELHMQERRLKNVMGLVGVQQLNRAKPVINSHFLQVFSSVNIADSKLMREMTEAAVRDSAGTSQGENVV